MANQSESRESGPESGGQSGNARTDNRQPIGGGQISREPEKGARVGGEGHVSQQSNTDGGEPSPQTSTAEEESGQL